MPTFSSSKGHDLKIFSVSLLLLFPFFQIFSYPFVLLSSSLCFVDYSAIMTEFLPIMLLLWHKLSTLVQVWHWTFPPLLGANEVNSGVMVVGHHHLCCCWRSLNTHDCWWWVFSLFLGLGLHLSYLLICCQMWNLYNFMIRSALHSIHVAINFNYGEAPLLYSSWRKLLCDLDSNWATHQVALSSCWLQVNLHLDWMFGLQTSANWMIEWKVLLEFGFLPLSMKRGAIVLDIIHDELIFSRLYFRFWCT